MTLQNVFLIDGRRGRQVSLPLVAVAVILNGLVLFNAVWHDPRTGYDVAAHLTNAMVLSEGRLPTRGDGVEFFSPPLPYLPAAGVMAMSRWLGQEGRQAALVGMKVGQTFNLFWSLVLTWGLLSVGQRLERSSTAGTSNLPPTWGDGRVRLAALGLILLLPVYFKTFAMMRGEPAVAALMVLAVDQLTRRLAERRYGLGGGLGLGMTLGLMALSRQWGVFFYPAAVLAAWAAWRREKAFVGPDSRRRAVLAMAVSATLTTALVGGWFYAHLRHTEGSATVFNRTLEPLSFSNRPASFYLDPALDELFTHPVRPAFARRMIPILWSDLWGDYWGYWSVWAQEQRSPHRWYLDGKQLQDIFVMFHEQTGQTVDDPGMVPGLRTNYFDVGPYLGRANVLGLPIALILLVSLAQALKLAWRFLRRPAGVDPAGGLTATLVLVTLIITGVGYLVFLIRVPFENEGDTVKATYLLQVLVLLAWPWGLWWRRAWRDNPRAARWLALVVLAVGLHNAPLLVTRFLRFWT